MGFSSVCSVSVLTTILGFSSVFIGLSFTEPSFISNSGITLSFCAILILIPINPIGVCTWAISSSTIVSAWYPDLGRIPAVCFSKAERSPRNLPDTVICTPIAPPSIICCNVHIVALLKAVPRSIWEPILLHITDGDNSGFAISSTAIWGFFNP